MYSFSSAIATPNTSPITPTAQALSVSRIDRWFVYHRLQELLIPCWCLQDGSLWVEVKDSTTAVLVSSVVKQCAAPRQELLSWLERCWQMES